MRHFILIISSMFLLVSCRTHETIIQKKEIKYITPFALYDSLKSNYGFIKSMTGKFKAEIIQNKKSNNVYGTVKIKKDSILWFSINPGLGIEVARLQCLKDSVSLIDRYNSKYFSGNYLYLNSLIDFDVDFSSIQSIFLNTLSFFSNVSDTASVLKNVIIKKDKNGKFIQIENYRKRIIRKNEGDVMLPPVYERVKVDNRNVRICEIFIKDFKDNRELFIEYSDFIYKDILKSDFPQKIHLLVKGNNNTIILNIDYSKQDFNVDSQFQFSIPSSYKFYQINQK